MTVTLVIPDGLNGHRLAVPALNGNFAHLQPGDTRFLALDTTGLSAAPRDILRRAATARSCVLPPDSPELLHVVGGWLTCR